MKLDDLVNLSTQDGQGSHRCLVALRRWRTDRLGGLGNPCLALPAQFFPLLAPPCGIALADHPGLELREEPLSAITDTVRVLCLAKLRDPLAYSLGRVQRVTSTRVRGQCGGFSGEFAERGLGCKSSIDAACCTTRRPGNHRRHFTPGEGSGPGAGRCLRRLLCGVLAGPAAAAAIMLLTKMTYGHRCQPGSSQRQVDLDTDTPGDTITWTPTPRRGKDRCRTRELSEWSKICKSTYLCVDRARSTHKLGLSTFW